MSIFSSLKKFIAPGDRLSWREPNGMWLRLRNDLLARLSLGLGVCLLVLGVACMVPWPLEAGIVLGGIGGIVLAGLVIGWPELRAGSITITEHAIERQWVSPGLTWMTMHTDRWFVGAISQCVIVPWQSLGKGMSVLVIDTGSSRDVIGMKRSLDPDRVARFLVERGVKVSYADAIPPGSFRPHSYPAGLVPAAMVIGCILGIGVPVVRISLFEQGAAPKQDRGGLAAVRDQFRPLADRDNKHLGPIGRPPGPKEPEALWPFRSESAPAGAQAGAGQGNVPFQVAQPESIEPSVQPGQATPQPPGQQSKAQGSDQPPKSSSPLLPQIEAQQPASHGSDQPAPQPPRFGPLVGKGPAGPADAPSRMPFGGPFAPRGRASPPRPGMTPPPPAPSTLRPVVRGSSGRTTDLVGGPGGMPFESVSEGCPVLGCSWVLGQWAGQPALARLEPIFDRAAPPAAQQVVAKENYALGALEVDAPQFVCAVRLVFMRIGADGRLDPLKTRTPAIGSESPAASPHAPSDPTALRSSA